MNWKKIGVYLILLTFVLVATSGLVMAATAEWSEIGMPGVLKYFFGKVFVGEAGVSPQGFSAAIVTIAIWLLIFITFGDIFATFTSFSKWVSWLIGLLVALIVANFGLPVAMIGVLTAVLAGLGMAAVYVALGAAFVAFIAVNLGIRQLGMWVMRRKAMEAGAKSEAGGKKLAGTIKGLGDAGKALRQMK